MVGIIPAQIVDVQGQQGVIDKALEKFMDQIHIKIADPRTRNKASSSGT